MISGDASVYSLNDTRGFLLCFGKLDSTAIGCIH